MAESEGEADAPAPQAAAVEEAVGAAEAPLAAAPAAPDVAPNELGLIPVLEYHLIEEGGGQWRRPPERFRRDLELLYERGYRPVSISDIVDRKIDLPAGMRPVAIVFDDASPSQFRYIEKPDGTLEIDPQSAIGIWLDFRKTHPDWENKAVFCVLSGAEAGRSFFGDRGIEGQKTEWRHRKIRFLVEQGFEICNHTLWHARLDKMSDEAVQEQIARLALAVDSAVPGYRIRTFALPLGMWPKNRRLAMEGSWRDPRTGRVISYRHDAVLEVAGGPNVSPYDPKFDPHSIDRVIVFGDQLEKTLDRLEKKGYVSAGPKSAGRSAP